MNDEYYMRKTLSFALKGQGCTSPNPLVGCVIVKNGKIIARGFHRKAGLPHAEIEALKKAGLNSRNSCVYVNLEPCFHWGRTPPCVDALIEAKVKRVVIGVKDPNPLVSGRSIKKLKRHGIQVKINVLKQEAKKLNEVFFTNIQKQRPFVALKVAQTLDGKIADSEGKSKWITGCRARENARRLRGIYDAVLVGINTVLKDDPCLACGGKNIVKVIIDPDLKISPEARIFSKVEKVVIFTKKNLNKERQLSNLSKKAHIISIKYYKDGFKVNQILNTLYSLAVSSVFVEGGGYTLGKFLEAKIIDKLYIFVAPKIMGQKKGIDSFSGTQNFTFDSMAYLERLTVEKMGKDYLFCGYPRF